MFSNKQFSERKIFLQNQQFSLKINIHIFKKVLKISTWKFLLPRRGYCVEQSKKSCSSVHTSVRLPRNRSGAGSGLLFGTFVKVRWSLTVQKLIPPVPVGKSECFDHIWIILDDVCWTRLFGLLYTIVPKGATHALRVLSSYLLPKAWHKNMIFQRFSKQ